MSDVTMTPQTPVSTPQRSDAEIWADILKLQLDGVMMHVALYEQCCMNCLCGMAAMHKHHGEEEFANYLHVLGDYMNEYKKVPETGHVSAPVVKLDGATAEEKMVKCMELYEDWEKKVCDYLKIYEHELTEGKYHVDELRTKVHKELKYINLMMNDLLDGNWEELSSWLEKKWGD